MTLPSENGVENEEEIASAAKVIKSLIKALAKMEEKQDSGSSSLLRLPNSNPTRFLPDEDFAFESDLHYGSYNGIRHG